MLHNMLDHCVQRKGYEVIRDQLKPKREFVLSIRLSDKQIELYRAYLQYRNLEHGIVVSGRAIGAQLFADFHELSRIWTHPWAIKLNEIRAIRNEERAADRDFIDDGGSSAEELEIKSEPSVPSPSSGGTVDDDDDIIELDVVPKPKKLKS